MIRQWIPDCLSDDRNCTDPKGATSYCSLQHVKYSTFYRNPKLWVSEWRVEVGSGRGAV